MREILFRGKRIDNGEWVYGDLVQSPDYDVVQIYEQDLCGDNFSVDPSTIGQYTGLTDKNDKKIFEGDIVKHLSDNMVYLIEYDNRFGMYVSKQKGSSYSGCIRCEIIGNIHDSPELLEDRL